MPADAAMTPLVLLLTSAIEPGASVFVSVPYDALDNTPMTLPDNITVVIARWEGVYGEEEDPALSAPPPREDSTGFRGGGVS